MTELQYSIKQTGQWWLVKGPLGLHGTYQDKASAIRTVLEVLREQQAKGNTCRVTVEPDTSIPASVH